ncbi:MAG: bifunctional rhamnulose-1-phosphate aldolase/short-chain dehydrogenase [Proteobacteria bacterium]|nr:bifunctional rhamnulose-1-phosphate aldolase/short-chain dehydrogenase [Pseudomonadota bacterium]
MAVKNADRFKFVNYLWDDEVAASLDPVDLLIYRSNLLGADQRVTNTGGGNTSGKIIEPDPLTGKETEVMWVKGSGGDLRTSKKANFSSLYQSKLMALQDVYAKMDNTGLKSEAEDAMVQMYTHCTFNLNPRATSIDTPLHSFIPYKHVDHMHPNSIIALAAAKDSEKLTQEIFGDEIAWVPWTRPGFELGLLLQETIKKNPNAKGILMGGHGIINWAETSKECSALSLDLIERAAQYIDDRDKGENTFGGAKFEPLPKSDVDTILNDILPTFRGMVSQEKRFIATVQSDPTILRFVNSFDAEKLAELGTSCPDHFLRTKIKPLYVDWNPQQEDVASLKSKLESGLETYRADYLKYYEACVREGSPAVRIANPTVILIPGIGMIAWGQNKSESRVTAEFYNCAIEVMRGAEALTEYVAIPPQEAFDIEYWALEEAKLQRMPKEKEMARRVVVVVGAGSGIGKSTAFRFAQEGAHVVCADLNADLAKQTADDLIGIYGQGIGVGGTGIAACGPAISFGVDITKRDSIQALYKNVIAAYGGLDHVVLTAGIFVPPDKEGNIADEKWGLTFDINVIGGFLVADEAKQIWEKQGLKGTLVLTTSVNAAVPKKGSLAYDTSKAAANHLVRELAIELSPTIRVNGLAPATVVKGSSMFPRDRVISSLAKYNIEFSESEDTEVLRDKLAQFYANRTLTKTPVTPEDQAEVAYLLSSQQLGLTTGQIISVDGGLHEAFLR